MRIGLVEFGGERDFAAQNEDGAWVSLRSMGIDAIDTADVIVSAPALRRALTSGEGTPVTESTHLLCPVVRPSKMMAIGLNYMDHIRETEAEVPDRPIVFAKYPSALNGPYEPILIDDRMTQQLDYEVELAVVIGRRTRSVNDQEALDCIFGYCVGNDVSARDLQNKESQFLHAKSMDTFCPLGPWITTRDEIPDPQGLAIRSAVNGERRQDSTTKEMIFSVGQLIAYISQGITLEPGDVLLTGTPHGVGFVMHPPVFLHPGDTVACEVEGLGRLANEIVAR